MDDNTQAIIKGVSDSLEKQLKLTVEPLTHRITNLEATLYGDESDSRPGLKLMVYENRRTIRALKWFGGILTTIGLGSIATFLVDHFASGGK